MEELRYRVKVERDFAGNTHTILVDPDTMQPLPPVPHMDYPKMLYGAGGKTLIVRDPDMHMAAMDTGEWYKDPTEAPSPAQPLSGDVDIEALRAGMRAEMEMERDEQVRVLTAQIRNEVIAGLREEMSGESGGEEASEPPRRGPGRRARQG